MPKLFKKLKKSEQIKSSWNEESDIPVKNRINGGVSDVINYLEIYKQ